LKDDCLVDQMAEKTVVKLAKRLADLKVGGTVER
jgi:hypothetical protein